MKKILKSAVVLTATVFVLASCASTPKFDQAVYDEAYLNGDYATCASMLETKKASHSEIKKSIDVNMLKYYAGDNLSSAKGFLETKQQFQDVAGSMTAGKVIQASLTGENSIEYYGPVYERIASYSMRAVNAIELGEMDKTAGVVKDYTESYKEIVSDVIRQQNEIAEASDKSSGSEDTQKALTILKKIGIDLNLSQFAAPEKYKSVYETSPLMSYVGTVSYAANDDFDHAADFEKILSKDNSSLDMADVLSVPAGKGRLEVLSLSGTVGQRTEFATDIIQIGTYQGVPICFKFTYPQFSGAEHKIDSVEVSLSNGDTKKAVVVEDFDLAVLDDVKSKQRGAYNRSLSRNIVKNSVAIGSVVAADVTRQKASGMAQQIAEAAYQSALLALPVAMPLIIDAEHADVRQSVYLPHMASAAGFTVDAGTYTVTVKYMSNGSVVEEKTIENVAVANGKVSVVSSSCAK